MITQTSASAAPRLCSPMIRGTDADSAVRGPNHVTFRRSARSDPPPTPSVKKMAVKPAMMVPAPAPSWSAMRMAPPITTTTTTIKPMLAE